MNRIIRTNGESELIPFPPKVDYICQKLGNATLDSVMLRHLGLPMQVMYVDDQGIEKGKPVNEEATALYHANCRRGESVSAIYGDVAVVYENDLTD